MLTERQAWRVLGEGYSANDPRSPLGLCGRVVNLRRASNISPTTRDKMLWRIAREGRRMRKSYADIALGYLWPFGEEGRVARKAFCTRMERNARRREDLLLALAISLGVIVVRLCLWVVVG